MDGVAGTGLCVVMPVRAQLTDSQVESMQAKIRVALFVPNQLPAQLSVIPMAEWERELLIEVTKGLEGLAGAADGLRFVAVAIAAAFAADCGFIQQVVLRRIVEGGDAGIAVLSYDGERVHSELRNCQPDFRHYFVGLASGSVAGAGAMMR